MDKIKLILGASILLLSGQVNADIIDATNTNTEYAPGKHANLQGLQWLTLDETIGESYDSVVSGYKGLVNEGWRYATRQETETLTGSLWGGTISGWSQDNANGARWFNDIFSVTSSTPSSFYSVLDHSYFFFGVPGDCDSDPSLTCFGAVSFLTRGPLPGAITPSIRVSDGESLVQELVPFESYGFFTDTWGLDAGLYDWNSTRLNTLESATLASLLVRSISPATIDIKPDSDPNSINPRSNGVIPVAVLGSIDFDATQVDFLTVKFGPDEAPPAHDGHVEDVNDDGYMDMMFHFKTQETGIVCGDTEATLTGETFEDTQFTGTDTIKTVGCNGNSSEKVDATSIEGAGAVNWMLLIGLSVLGLWRQNGRQ